MISLVWIRQPQRLPRKNIKKSNPERNSMNNTTRRTKKMKFIKTSFNKFQANIQFLAMNCVVSVLYSNSFSMRHHATVE